MKNDGPKTKLVSKDEFHAKIRAEEVWRNAGCTTAYEQNADMTWWYVDAACVGLSRGRLGTNSDYYLIEMSNG
jgi:hypothetical protein